MILGELLRCPDRIYYNDFWNAKDIGEMWRKWNLPIRDWMVNTIYIPLGKKGYSDKTRVILCFFVSALFHEYMVSIVASLARSRNPKYISGYFPISSATNLDNSNYDGASACYILYKNP